MKVFTIVSLLALASVWAADAAHLKAKARLLGKLAGRHHKRGVVSSIPTFKLGHDLPVVSHSIVKPLVVTYPPTALPLAVKVPVTNPYLPRYPPYPPHKVPHHHHHHIGLKIPHHHTKTVVVPKPDHHFHHHHHHVPPKPVVPVVPVAPVPATPIVPIAQPSVPVPQPLPAPPPPVFHPAPQPTVFHPAPPPSLAPQALFPPQHFHLRPLVPTAPVVVPTAPVALPAPLAPSPVVPVAPHYKYVLRPGNAVQTSVFATYPRYPFVNYQSPVVPFDAGAVAPVAPAGPVLLDRPAQVPHFAVPHAAVHNSPIPVQPTPALLHHTAGVAPTPAIGHLDHDGWSPIPAHAHFDGIGLGHEEAHHITQEQAAQVFEHHVTEEQQYHDLQQQIHHHIQQQIEQAQYDQQLHEQNVNQEYGPPQPFPPHINQEYGHPNQEVQPDQGYPHPQQEYGVPQQEYPQHLDQEYGAPQQQGFEGRSSTESEDDTQKYHNHIPLGLQPPIDKPLEEFR